MLDTYQQRCWTLMLLLRLDRVPLVCRMSSAQIALPSLSFGRKHGCTRRYNSLWSSSNRTWPTIHFAMFPKIQIYTHVQRSTGVDDHLQSCSNHSSSSSNRIERSNRIYLGNSSDPPTAHSWNRHLIHTNSSPHCHSD